MSDNNSWKDFFEECGVPVTVTEMDCKLTKPTQEPPCRWCGDTGWVDVGGGMASIGCPIHHGREVERR